MFCLIKLNLRLEIVKSYYSQWIKCVLSILEESGVMKSNLMILN